MKKIILAVLSLLIFSFSACTKADTFTPISPEDAVKLLEKDSRAVLIDVRTPEENKAIRIPDSILIPDYEIRTPPACAIKDCERVPGTLLYSQ